MRIGGEPPTASREGRAEVTAGSCLTSTSGTWPEVKGASSCTDGSYWHKVRILTKILCELQCITSKTSLSPTAQNRGCSDSLYLGTFGNVCRHFGWGMMLGERLGNADKYLKCPGSSTKRNYPTHNVNSAEDEELCFRAAI